MSTNNRNIYTDDRFSKLSEKISRLQNTQVKSPSKIIDFETRIDNLQMESIRNLKDLEFKMKYLEEELLIITKMIEDSIVSKNNLRIKISNEVKETENKIKQMFEAERQGILDSNLEIFRNFEKEFLRLQDINKKERLDIGTYVQDLRNVIESDISKLKSDSDSLKEERLQKFTMMVNTMKEEFKYLNDLISAEQVQAEASENGNVDLIDDMIKNLKNQIDLQKEKRNKFEENVLQLIDDTCKKLTKYIQDDNYIE